MVNLEDIKIIKNNVRHYRLYCDKCGGDRGYHQKSRSSMLCKKCTHANKNPFDHTSLDFKQKMSVAKRGQIPVNKGQKMSSEFCQKVSLGKMANSLNLNAKFHRPLRQQVNNLINSKFYNRKIGKEYGALRHLDFTFEELITHLESQFYPNPITGEVMTWENRGRHGWHIDHVVPDSWFTYRSMDDQGFKDSWALSNLQPKWAHENLSKNNRFVG